MTGGVADFCALAPAPHISRQSRCGSVDKPVYGCASVESNETMKGKNTACQALCWKPLRHCCSCFSGRSLHGPCELNQKRVECMHSYMYACIMFFFLVSLSPAPARRLNKVDGGRPHMIPPPRSPARACTHSRTHERTNALFMYHVAIADGAERPDVLGNLCGGVLLHGRQHVSLRAQVWGSGLVLSGGVVGAVGSIGRVLRWPHWTRSRPSGEAFDARGFSTQEIKNKKTDFATLGYIENHHAWPQNKNRENGTHEISRK